MHVHQCAPSHYSRGLTHCIHTGPLLLRTARPWCRRGTAWAKQTETSQPLNNALPVSVWVYPLLSHSVSPSHPTGAAQHEKIATVTEENPPRYKIALYPVPYFHSNFNEQKSKWKQGLGMRLGTCVTSSSGALPSSEHDSSSKTISTPASWRMSPCKQGLLSAASSLLLSLSSQCGDLPSSPLNDLPSLVGVSPSGKPTWQECPSSVN